MNYDRDKDIPMNYYPNIVLDTENELLNPSNTPDSPPSFPKLKIHREPNRSDSEPNDTLNPSFSLRKRQNMTNLAPNSNQPKRRRTRFESSISMRSSKNTLNENKMVLSTSPTPRKNINMLKKSMSKNSSKLAMLIKATQTFKRNKSQRSFVIHKDADVMNKLDNKERIDHDDKNSVKTKEYGWFGNLFFFSTNRLFEISQRRKILRQDIGNLPAAVRVNKVVKKFERIYYKELDKSTNIKLWQAIYKFQKKNIITSIFLRILSDLIMILVPLLTRQYSKNLRNKSGVKILECSLLLFTIPLMILIQNLLKEHSSKYISIVKTNIGQAFRGVLYNKLVNADYNFLMKSDPSFLSRLIFFEFESIFDFLGSLPSFVSSPFAICFSAILVIINLSNLNIWFMTIATLSQISLFLFLFNWLNFKVMKGRNRYYFIGSNISIKIQELISSIEMVRVNNFQEYFMKNFIKLRSEAEKALGQVHRSYGTIEFLLILTPFIFSSVIVSLYSFLSTTKIETSTTLTVISMMVAVTVPLRSYSDGLRKLRICQAAYSCTNCFFETIKEKRSDVVDDGGILTGEVKFENCQFISDKGAAVKKIKDAFSRHQSSSKSDKFNKKFTLVKSSSQKSARVIPATSNSKTFNNNIQKTVLKNVSFYIQQKEKICVIGREGCGKDELFLAIISELKLISGTMKRRGKFAFLDMNNPKFLNATIRENIILGDEYDEDKFNEVLEVVGFNVDKYEGRDLTEIVEGERNLNQQDKKKILLARLLYSDADILLINLYFDQVSKDKQQPIFEKIVRGYLKYKTVIYTSDVNLLVKLSDRIFVFKNGKLVERGTYDDLIGQRKSHMYEVIMTDNTGSSNFFGKILEGLRIYPKEVDVNEIEKEERLKALKIAVSRKKMTKISHLSKESIDSQIEASNNIEKNSKEKIKETVTNLMSRKLDRIRGKKVREEQSTVLENTNYSFKTIFTIRGLKRVLILLLLFLCTTTTVVSIQFWLAFWLTDAFSFAYSSYFYTYIIIFFSLSIFAITRQIYFSNSMTKNLTKIYLMAITSMMNAKKNWYDQNPSSRIVYLLTKDQMVVDYDLIRSLFVVMDSFLIIVLIFSTLNYFYIGLMLLISFPLYIIAKKLYSRYRIVSSKLIAFDTKTRAEMIDIYLELLDNLTMLRNYGKGDYYEKVFASKTNEFQMSTTSLYNFSMRWLNIRITLFSMLSIFFILGLPLASKMLFTSIYLKENWQLAYAANVGPFILTSIINFSRFLPIMSLNILSLQRIFHYMFDLAGGKGIGEGEGIGGVLGEGNGARGVAEIIGKLETRFKGRALRQERNKYFGLHAGHDRDLRRSYSIQASKQAHERVLKIKVVDKFVNEVKIKNLRSQLGNMNLNKYQIQTGPVILLENISYSTPNAKILRNISLKVYQSEKIAVIGESHSGRHSLINLLLLIEKRDESDSNLSSKSKPPRNANAFDLGYRKNRKSYFELLGENVDYCDPEKLRKELIYLSQYPSLFSGTVRDNIDPYKEFDEQEIIRTLHYLKIFPALQSFTGFENCHEIAITLKEREGVFEVNEIDIDDFFTIRAQESFKREKREVRRVSFGKKKRRRSKKRVSNLEIPMNQELIDIVGGKSELNKIRKSILNSGVMETLNNDSIHEYFREQLDNEIPVAERAKRIDERLQEFDGDYSTHRVLFPDEKQITEIFLKMQVGQNGKNLNLTLRKLIQLARVFLKQPRVIIMDEDCLIMPEFDPKFFIESLFKTMNNSAIISLVKNYRQLYHYTRSYILENGKIVEEGNPLQLVDNKNSLLYKILVKDDIRTVRQLEMKLEKNVRKFEEDQEATVKYIQELMKNEIENEMKNSNKTEKEKEELRSIMRAISPRNIKNMVERMKTGDIEDESEDKEFKIRMDTLDDKIKIPLNQKSENLIKINNRRDNKKYHNKKMKKNQTVGDVEKHNLRNTKTLDQRKQYKNQISLASNAGIDLFLTPASRQESIHGDGEESIEIIFNGEIPDHGERGGIKSMRGLEMSGGYDGGSTDRREDKTKSGLETKVDDVSFEAESDHFKNVVVRKLTH